MAVEKPRVSDEKRKQQLRDAKKKERDVKRAAGLKQVEVWFNPQNEEVVIKKKEK